MSLLSSKHVIKKIVMLGDSGTGKTSLVRRYVIDQFDDKYITTIGTKILKKDIEFKYPNRTIFLTMILWDMLGQREYRKMRALGIKDTSGVILVSDLSRPETITGLTEFWDPQVKEVVGQVPTIVIGNKSDLVPADSASIESLKTTAGQIGAQSFICSAKTGENVEDAFRVIGTLITEAYMHPADMPVGAEGTTYATAVDDMISDFCEQFEDPAKGMEIIDILVKKTDMNINTPTKDTSLALLELMADSERDRLGREISKVNKMRRWKMLEEITMKK